MRQRIQSIFPFCFVFLCCIVISIFSSSSSYAKEKIFGAETAELENGLQIVLIPNHRVPVVTHMVWYKVGAADEPIGKSGKAHYLEHLMFKGSDNVAPGDFSRILKSIGGQDNAFTAQDYTAYFQSIPAEHLDQIMAMEADRMRGMTVPQDHFDSEKQVVLEERRQVTENDPRRYFFEKMIYGLYPNHPYGRPIIGWMHEIQQVSRDDVLAFHNQYYAPNNAVLVVSGDITMDDLLPLAKKHYGVIPAKSIPKRDWTDIPPLPGEALYTLQHPSIQEAQFYRIYRAPSYRQNKDDSLALQVLENILSGGQSTRLYQSLVANQKKAVSVNLNYRASSYGPGQIWLSAIPAESTTFETLMAAIQNEFEEIALHGIADDELETAKQRLKDEAVFARDSLYGPARIFGSLLLSGYDIDDIEYWPYMIDEVTSEQIQRVAQNYLAITSNQTTQFVTGHVIPSNPAPSDPSKRNQAQEGEIQ